jgi:hypothetical protein
MVYTPSLTKSQSLTSNLTFPGLNMITAHASLKKVKVLPSPNTHKKYFIAQIEIKLVHVAIQLLHRHKTNL